MKKTKGVNYFYLFFNLNKYKKQINIYGPNVRENLYYRKSFPFTAFLLLLFILRPFE